MLSSIIGRPRVRCFTPISFVSQIPLSGQGLLSYFYKETGPEKYTSDEPGFECRIWL